MIYKNISSKAIIRKVFRDLNPSGDNWIEDAIEWIGEALEHIGSAAQFETKRCVIEIVDYKAVLPKCLYYINQVSSSGITGGQVSTELATIKKKIDDLTASLAANPNQDLNYQLRDLSSRVIILESAYFKDPSTLTPLKYGTATFPKDIHCNKCVNEGASSDDWYVIENGYIKTSFKTGEVCMSYAAFPIDEECYPLVPDDISFKEAMFWYVYKKLILLGKNKGMNGIDYVFADKQWKYYCTQARNAANYPDLAKYASFMNQWVRLIPELNNHESDFGDMGTRETLNRN
tara:strand:- start:297 stop:1163 length:867 start_codon:yes stop_codon:yes gene_type:complete